MTIIINKDKLKYLFEKLRLEFDILFLGEKLIKSQISDTDLVNEINEESTSKIRLSSLKNILLPVEEALPTAQSIQDYSKKEVIVFGIKACDVYALNLTDRVFLEGEIDTLYEEKRKRLVICGRLCKQKGETCFCDLVGVEKLSASGMDIVYNVDEYCISIEEGSVKGKRIIEKIKQILQGDFKEEESEVKETIENGGNVQKYGEDRLTRISRWITTMKENRIWEKYAHICYGCGICTLLCPACWCFDLKDISSNILSLLLYGRCEKTEKENELNETYLRIRCPDSCQLPSYATVAGGANMLEKGAERIRHRIFHKLVYIPDRYNLIGCSGCGRCVATCPQGIDIRELILNAIKKE